MLKNALAKSSASLAICVGALMTALRAATSFAGDGGGNEKDPTTGRTLILMGPSGKIGPFISRTLQTGGAFRTFAVFFGVSLPVFAADRAIPYTCRPASTH
ncbi:MAG: hypothetical protein EA377_00270 [Phycisphaerales bacterium]|nr:MAG: hypothetical protein EA377_00270 [Phycisphaerales bacterium]